MNRKSVRRQRKPIIPSGTANGARELRDGGKWDPAQGSALRSARPKDLRPIRLRGVLRTRCKRGRHNGNCGGLRSRLTRQEFVRHAAFEVTSASSVEPRSGEAGGAALRKAACGGGGRGTINCVAGSEWRARTEKSWAERAGRWSGEGELRASTYIMPKKCLLFKKNLAKKIQGRAEDPSPG
jgi:hypothetical protein